MMPAVVAAGQADACELGGIHAFATASWGLLASSQCSMHLVPRFCRIDKLASALGSFACFGKLAGALDRDTRVPRPS